MKILLVAATKPEVAPLLKKSKKDKYVKNLFHLICGSNRSDILITGVGMTATAFEMGKIKEGEYDFAVNVGIAGSFKKDIALTEVVYITQDCFSGLGSEDGTKFLTADQLHLGKTKVGNYPIRNKKLLRTLIGIKKARGITVNTVHGNSGSIKKVIQRLHPDIESMEGAAFFYACNKLKLPCVQIRSISNYIERRNKKKWQVLPAINKLNEFLGKVLLEI